jgi:hypothetical protein
LLQYQQILNYTTRDYLRTFQFGFVAAGSGWRAYILNPIDYGGLANDGSTTHRYYDAQNNLCFICWDPEPATLEEMQAVAAMWCELTHTYLNTGETIDNQYARIYGRRG